MKLEYKNTIYDPLFEITNDNEGLRPDDFWINIHFQLKNEDIDYNGNIKGMSFKELQDWNKMNKEFLDGKMKENKSIEFIRRIGEITYYPKEDKVEKRVYLFDELNKYYSIYFTRKELEEIYLNNKEFIDGYLSKK